MSHIAVRNRNYFGLYGKPLAKAIQIKNTHLLTQQFPLESTPKEIKALGYKGVCTKLFTANFLAAKSSQSKCPPREEWFGKLQCIQIMEYYIPI